MLNLFIKTRLFMKTCYKTIQLFVLLLLVTTLAIAQDTSVSGKVTDENGGGYVDSYELYLVCQT